MEVVSSIALRALEVISFASDDALSLGLPPVLFTGAASATESAQIAAGNAVGGGRGPRVTDRCSMVESALCSEPVECVWLCVTP